MLDVVFGQASDTGRVWPRNADSAAVFMPRSRQELRSRGWMFAVADGRGGSDLGAIASARAVQILVEGFSRIAEGASLASLMPRLIQEANGGVHDEALEPDRRGRVLSTSVVCCALRNDAAVISHVGHSRCYLIRDRQPRLLTRDHTWAAQEHGNGILSSTEAERSGQRHQLTRSLGPEMFVTVETGCFPLHAGDSLVLCTDGLYEAMYPEDIARLAAQDKHPNEIARELVEYAVQSDGSDNTTAQVIRVRSVEAASVGRPRTAAAS